MAELNWTLEAEQWLRDIYDHIAEDNPIAAARVVEGIYQRAQVLLDFPQIGFRYQGSEREIRILLYGHYRIAYLASVRPKTVSFDWPTKIHSIALGATNQYRYVFGRFLARVNEFDGRYCVPVACSGIALRAE